MDLQKWDAPKITDLNHNSICPLLIQKTEIVRIIQDSSGGDRIGAAFTGFKPISQGFRLVEVGNMSLGCRDERKGDLELSSGRRGDRQGSV